MAKEPTPGELAEQRATTEPNVESGRTSRDDPLDLGVPMAEAGDNPRHYETGPEDALATDPEVVEGQRGDYEDRIGSSEYRPHQTVLNEDGEVVVIDQRTGEVVSDASEGTS